LVSDWSSDVCSSDLEEAPAIAHFCIKNIENWEAGNKDNYLDPIFDGMPHAATLNN